MLAIDIIFSVILYLSTFDRQLSTRSEHKAAAALASNSPQEFVQKMQSSVEDGHHFSCGLTRSWVSEAFEGLEAQYEEYKSPQKNAGYKNHTGDSLIQMFKEAYNSSYEQIYNMKHLGTQDHDWVIQQLPYGKGYRILQSYHDAYSLKAWLSADYHEMFEEKEIIIPEVLKATVDGALKGASGGILNLSNFEQLRDYMPDEMKPMIPYLQYVKNVNQTIVEDFFAHSWKKFGGGRILSKSEFFDDYLYKTKILMDYFKENDATQNLFSKEIYDIWIELYGSPDPIYYPGLPNNFLSKQLTPGKHYYFEAKQIQLDDNQEILRQNVVKNGKLLRNSIDESQILQ